MSRNRIRAAAVALALAAVHLTPAVGRGDDDARLRAEGQKRAAEIKAMSDAEVAQLAARKILGQLNLVEKLEAIPKSSQFRATGSFTPAYVEDNRALRERLDKLLVAKYHGDDAEDLRRRSLPIATCIERARFEGTLAKGTPKSCEQNFGGSQGWDESDPVVAAVLLEGVLHALPAESQTPLRKAFADSLGHRRKQYLYDSLDTQSPQVLNRDTMFGVQLVSVPVSEWSFRTVRYAHEYAVRYGLDAQTIALFKAAIPKARRYKCRTLDGAFFLQQHEGGGRYGPTRQGDWDLGGGDETDCDAVAKIKSTDWAWGLLRNAKIESIPGAKWLAVKASGAWNVENSDEGNPIRKTQEATVYWREEY